MQWFPESPVTLPNSRSAQWYILLVYWGYHKSSKTQAAETAEDSKWDWDWLPVKV